MRGKKFYGYLLISLFCYGCSSFVCIWMTLLLGKILDYANQGNREQLLYSLALCIIGEIGNLLLMKVGIYFRMTYVKQKTVQLKDRILQGILRMPLREFLRKDQAYYLNCLTGDVDKIREDRYRSLPVILYQLLRFVLSFLALFTVSPLLLVAFGVSFLFMVMIPQLLSKPLERRQRESSSADERFLTSLKDTILAVEAVKLNGAGEGVAQRFHQSNLLQQEKDRRRWDLKVFASEISNTTESLAQIFCNGIGGLLVILGKVTVGDLVVTLQLANYAFQSIGAIVEKTLSLRSVSQLFDKIRFLENPAEKTETGVRTSSAEVRYENFSISFDTRTIIQNFTQTFAAGKVYAIIGPSGCGKSTLVKTLLKYYDTYTGAITLGGQDIREIPEEELYRHIKFIEQSPRLFNATLRENITLFRDYAPEAVEAVIRQVNLTELAEHYGDSMIGDEGNRISGGERQRIAIARALLEKPQIMIFDEPTSALDPQNTRAMMELIFSMRSVTRLVITHHQDAEFLSQFDQVIDLSRYK